MIVYGIIATWMVAMSISMLYSIREMKRIGTWISFHPMNAEVVQNSGVDEYLSIDEKIILRESAYDQRISEMKERLASTVPDKRVATHAQELHPDVKNLPHSVIDGKSGVLPDVEYAD